MAFIAPLINVADITAVQLLGKVAEEHETEDESNEPELVAWRQETWESIQKTQNAGTVEKIWAYWEFPGKGHSDNIEVNMYISIVSV